MLNYAESQELLVIRFPIRMDTFQSQEIENELNEMVNKATQKIIFDLEDVVFVSSYFLRICLNTLKTVGAERLTLQNVKSDIKKVFMIAGYDKYVDIK